MTQTEALPEPGVLEWGRPVVPDDATVDHIVKIADEYVDRIGKGARPKWKSMADVAHDLALVDVPMLARRIEYEKQQNERLKAELAEANRKVEALNKGIGKVMNYGWATIGWSEDQMNTPLRSALTLKGKMFKAALEAYQAAYPYTPQEPDPNYKSGIVLPEGP